VDAEVSPHVSQRDAFSVPVLVLDLFWGTCPALREACSSRY